jgi:hypothetical protein
VVTDAGSKRAASTGEVSKVRTPPGTTGSDAGFPRLFAEIGAHRNPQRQVQERDRARQQAIVGIVLPIF